MKNSIIVWILALSLVNLTGCKHDPIVDNGGDDRLVVVFISANSISSSLKSTASVDEDDVTEVILFGVDGSDAVVGQPHTIANPSSSGNSLIVPRTVEWFYAIANPSDDMKNPSLFSPTTVTDLEELVADFSDAPESPFLMSGIGEVQNYSAVINLVRTIAKIEVIGKNGFVVETVTVLDTPDEGYVFPKDPIEVPLTASPEEYDTFEATKDEFNNPLNIVTFYIPENVKETPTRFKVTGTLDEVEPITYTFELKQNKTGIDIKRNTRYSVGISPINLFEGTIDLEVTEWEYEVTQPHGFSSYKDGIKILAIGNSFAHNAMQYLPDLLIELGVSDAPGAINLVAAYQDGADLNYHVTTGVSQWDAYYRINYVAGDNTVWDGSGFNLEDIIKLEAWDVITLQQSSTNSGDPTTYNGDLDYLIEYVDNIMTAPLNPKNNPNYKLGWHMTWAWEEGHDAYWSPPNYGTQSAMYEAICSTVQDSILHRKGTVDAFDFIIPSGTAVQNARNSFVGDNLTWDPIHLNNLGCYIVATMWVKSILHYDISLLGPYNSSPVDEWGSPETLAELIGQPMVDNVVKWVNDAYAYPFVVSQ